MCIAIAKNKGIDLPSKEIFENCFINNDDGSGFAFAHNGRVIIKKGYMKFDDFYNALMEMDKKYNLKELGCLFHFRIATHGAKDETMTHPFPIVSDDGALKKIEFISDYAIVHNGVIQLTSIDATKSVCMSDTAIFVRDYLSNIAQNKNWFKKKCNLELIEKLIDSKMAILDKYGNIKMTDGFVCDNGVYYSNTTYKYKYSYSYAKNYGFHSPYSYGYYNDYDDDYDFAENQYRGISEQKISTIQLMKLDNGTIITDGGMDEVVDDKLNGFSYYIDDIGNLYWHDLTDKEDETYWCLGLATYTDKFGKEIEFSSVNAIDVDVENIDFDDYDYPCEETNSTLVKTYNQMGNKAV